MLTFEEYTLTAQTDLHGLFSFLVGVDPTAIETLWLRIEDAHQRFMGSPLAQVANQLEKEVVVTSIFDTNSIEGGTLSEEETQLALEFEPEAAPGVEQRRAINLKNAYDLAVQAANTADWELDVDFIRQIHAAITADVPHRYNQPGLLRDNPKDVITHVGDRDHGGRYKPPQYGRDIQRLLESLASWHRTLRSRGVPALIRAPLVHYYFECIHPFWDGNGRVGRVLEATLLQQQGFRYAPFALARYYLEHIDGYFSLFNTCRKAQAKGRPHPNTPFVVFFLEGFLDSLQHLHDRVNRLVTVLLFENDLKRRHDAREINARQYAIASQ
ncbi:MAG TPA: Fic family protein, partial [Gammaproteobacteria bacterium]|nr:Fic family protein [Gammaproteobacteria bacterium]